MADDKRKEEVTTFTPIHPFDMGNPKSWSSTIGMMNWDNDKIVFSKRSLLEFLRASDLTVNQNFSEIQKLPKYATFGRFNKAATDAAVADLVDAEIGDPTTDSPIHPSKSTVPRTTRKVAEPPGGKSSITFTPEEYEEQDALSLAPPRDGGDGVDVEIERLEKLRLHVESKRDGGAKIEDDKTAAIEEQGNNPPEGFRPTRKVREVPGGASSIGAAMFGESGGDAASGAPAGRKKQAPQDERRGFW